jgi:hypothetical protein
MTTTQFRAAYYNALVALFKTTPGTPENLEACETCARLYDLNPALADDVDDQLADDQRMNGSI